MYLEIILFWLKMLYSAIIRYNDSLVRWCKFTRLINLYKSFLMFIKS